MIDKTMAKLGYLKMKENASGCIYERHETAGDFTHVVAVMHKRSGQHIMQSYDKAVIKTNEGYINEACGVEIPVLILMWLKVQKLKIKYCMWR